MMGQESGFCGLACAPALEPLGNFSFQGFSLELWGKAWLLHPTWSAPPFISTAENLSQSLSPIRRNLRDGMRRDLTEATRWGWEGGGADARVGNARRWWKERAHWTS